MALVMWVSGIAAVADTETPSDDSMPGLGSFIVFAFLAVALYFLLKNMNARLRRMSYREKEREAAEREAQESAGPGVPDLARGEDEAAFPSGDEASDGESRSTHTDPADPTLEPPTGERGGRAT